MKRNNMFGNKSSHLIIIKYVFVFSVLIILSVFFARTHREISESEVKSSLKLLSLSTNLFQQPPNYDPSFEKITVPFDRLLDLPVKFDFLIKPRRSICDERTQLLIFVHSKLDHFDARNEIRLTWGSVQRSLAYRLIFLIGLQETNKTNKTIEQILKDEHKLNDDLVRGNFEDTYRNLTYKHVMGYKFVLHYCSAVKFIMKSDDDAFINIFEIIDLLKVQDNELHHFDALKPSNKLNLNFKTFRKPNLHKSYAVIKLLINGSQRTPELFEIQSKEDQSSSLNNYYYRKLIQNAAKHDLNFIACSLFPNGTKTRRKGKWCLSRNEYDPDYLPAYCSGIAYLMNMNALRTIYNHAHRMPNILFIDDLFLTGIVIQQAEQQPIYLNYSSTSVDHSEDYYLLNDEGDAQRNSNAMYNIQPVDTTDQNAKPLRVHNTKSSQPYAMRSIATKLDSKIGNKHFQILNWSELYNYRWQEFIKALAQKDNSFNSAFFINDLDKMPNRKKLVQIAWKKIKNYYLIP